MRLNLLRLFKRSYKDGDKWTSQSLKKDNFRLSRALKEANDTVLDQEKLLAEYDCLLAHSQVREADCKVKSFRPDHNITIPHGALCPKFNIDSCWIEDHWFCMDHDIECLRVGELHWGNGNPALALEHVTSFIAAGSFHRDINLAPCQELRCRVFIAALLQFFEIYEESNERICAIQRAIATDNMGTGQRLSETTSEDIIGITHYIQGRNLKELGRFSEAYLSFSRALEVPHYHEKARGFQEQLIVEETGKIGEVGKGVGIFPDGASDGASLHTLHSQQGGESFSLNHFEDYVLSGDEDW